MTAVAPYADIERLLCSGYTFDRVVSAGEDRGWSRDDVLAVLKHHQWDLDGSGRLPRNKRITTPVGLRGRTPAAPPPAKKPSRRGLQAELDELERTDPAVAAAARSYDEMVERVTSRPLPTPAPSAPPPTPAPAPPPPAADVETPPAPPRKPGRPLKPIDHGTDRGFQAHKRRGIPIPPGDPCGCHAAHKEKHADEQRRSYRKHHPKPATTSQPPPAPVTELPPAPPAVTAVECDEWFARARQSPRREVRRIAVLAAGALLQLRVLMDELARAERTTPRSHA